MHVLLYKIEHNISSANSSRSTNNFLAGAHLGNALRLRVRSLGTLTFLNYSNWTIHLRLLFFPSSSRERRCSESNQFALFRRTRKKTHSVFAGIPRDIRGSSRHRRRSSGWRSKQTKPAGPFIWLLFRDKCILVLFSFRFFIACLQLFTSGVLGRTLLTREPPRQRNEPLDFVITSQVTNYDSLY